MDFVCFLERVFCPARSAARARSLAALEAVGRELGIDFNEVAGTQMSVAAEVAAETGTPIPRDVRRMFESQHDDIPPTLPRSHGIASWGLIATMGAAGAAAPAALPGPAVTPAAASCGVGRPATSMDRLIAYTLARWGEERAHEAR